MNVVVVVAVVVVVIAVVMFGSRPLWVEPWFTGGCGQLATGSSVGFSSCSLPL